jgi:hypothetical protein
MAHMELSLKKLEEAVSIRRQMESLQRRLSSIFDGSSPAPSRRGSRRKMSAATRAKLSAAARARWAKRKGSSTRTASRKRKGSGLTPAGRRRLSQLMKARWAARRKSGASKK